ncbi:MAG: ABC transporter ATP-binding protein/permease [Candidatus Paracaedibacteraceae bacterium]|nr:ABC transporter ATP-binding protein/permease [Candidatus Paracaedibacteraceae bacterium]
MQGYKYLKDIFVQALSDYSMRWSFIGSACFLLIGVLTSLTLPLLLKYVMESLSNNETGLWVPWLLFSYGAIWMLSQVIQHIRSFLACRLEQRVTFLLGSKVLAHLYSLSHQYFINQKPGALANIIRRAQRNVPSVMLGLFFYILPTFVEFMCVIVGIMIFYSLFYVSILACVLASFFVYALLSIKPIIKLREYANNIDREVDGVVTDWISNYEAIKTFGRHDLAISVCNTELKKREEAEIDFIQRYTWVQIGQSFILGIGLSILTYYVGIGVRDGSLTVGDFVLFNGYMLQLVGPIGILGHLIQDIKKALIDMKGVLETLSTPSDIQEVENPVALTGSSFSVEFRNVSFGYDNRLILNQISFRVEAGQTAIITGKTGIGKSTIAKLLLRLYNPIEGEILINDINIKNIELDSLYKAVGWVPQESYLLNDTIMNNIRFVCPDAIRENIVEVVEKAHLEPLLYKLPDGLDTIVGDRGVKLSGGEKQRLTIARLFLKKPGLCIFDESTASLDKKTDAIIQKNIEQYLPHATKIIITHHPYLADKVNQVIVLNKNSSNSAVCIVKRSLCNN